MKEQEKEMVKRLQNGDKSAYEEIYKIYYTKCRKQAYYLCGNETDAKDIAQEAMLRVYTKIGQLKEVSYFEYWLQRIVHSQCMSMFRKRREATYDPEILKNYAKVEKRSEFLPKEVFDFGSDKEKLQELIELLKPKQCEAIELFYFQQLSIEEIANLLDIPTNTVKSRVFQARLHLSSLIKAYEKKHAYTFQFHGDLLLPSFFTMALGLITNHRKALKAVQLSSMTAAVVSVSVITVDIIKDNQIQDIPKVSETQKQTAIKSEVFPTVTYKDREITNPKDAYYVLKSLVPDESTFTYLSEEELSELETIVQALRTTDTRYRDQLDTSGWFELYDTYKISNNL